MFGDLDWPLNASRGFVSISWASCLHWLYTTVLCLHPLRYGHVIHCHLRLWFPNRLDQCWRCEARHWACLCRPNACVVRQQISFRCRVHHTQAALANARLLCGLHDQPSAVEFLISIECIWRGSSVHFHVDMEYRSAVGMPVNAVVATTIWPQFNGRSTRVRVFRLLIEWPNTGRWPASRSDADLFIYLGCSAVARS